jgi:hypothetical protein
MALSAFVIMLFTVFLLSAILSHGRGRVRIRRRLAAKAPQRACRAGEVTMGNSSADKLALKLREEAARSAHGHRIRPETRAAH